MLDTLFELGIEDYHLVGASYGAGVAVEVALTRPEPVKSLLLSAPGGSLIAEATSDLSAFFDAERSALVAGDLDVAVEMNVARWVDGPQRDADVVEPMVRDVVRRMQRRAFEITADWQDVEENELDPPALDRFAEVAVPTLVLVGALDLDAIIDTARRVTDGITGATASTGQTQRTCRRWNAPMTSSSMGAPINATGNCATTWTARSQERARVLEDSVGVPENDAHRHSGNSGPPVG